MLKSFKLGGSKSEFLKLQSSLFQEKTQENELEEKKISYEVLMIGLNYVPGSQESIDFL